MKFQEMNSDELLRELLLKPNNDLIWRTLKRTIVNEAIIATININGKNDIGISQALLIGIYGVVRIKRNGEDYHCNSEQNLSSTGDGS